jgi:hypothetical protein
MPRISALAHVAFDHNDSLRSREFIISWLNHTPHATAVYASCSERTYGAALPRPPSLFSRHATMVLAPSKGRLIR